MKILRSAPLLILAGCSTFSSSPATDGGIKTGTHAIGEACPNAASDCAPGLMGAGEDPGGGQCFKQCAPSTGADCGDTMKYACV